MPSSRAAFFVPVRTSFPHRHYTTNGGACQEVLKIIIIYRKITPRGVFSRSVFVVLHKTEGESSVSFFLRKGLESTFESEYNICGGQKCIYTFRMRNTERCSISDAGQKPRCMERGAAKSTDDTKCTSGEEHRNERGFSRGRKVKSQPGRGAGDTACSAGQYRTAAKTRKKLRKEQQKQ